MEITYELVKNLLEKYGYYTEDKVIWATINNINKMIKGNKKGQDIHAVCLEGTPGSGKTFYAETYKKVLSEILGEDVVMIDFQCDATTGKAELNEEIRVASAITGDADNVIIEGKLVQAIKAVNEGKHVILFLDEFEKAREDTDTYLYQFLQKGKINTVQLGDLEIDEDKKKNLQVILCKNYFRLHLSEPLERRLKFMRLEPMKPEVFLEVAKQRIPECDQALISMVSIFYDEMYKNRELFKRIPSCSELLDAINDANDILQIAPDKYILDAILSNILKNPEDFETFETILKDNDKLAQIANLLSGDEEKTDNKRSQLQYAILEDFFSEDIKRLAEELQVATQNIELLQQSNIQKDKRIQELTETLEQVAIEQKPKTDENQVTTIPDTIKIGVDYEVYHSNELDEHPSNLDVEGLKRYRFDKSIFDYSECDWNEIGSITLPEKIFEENDSFMARSIIKDLESSIVCRDGFVLENTTDFKLLIYKVKDGNMRRYRIFSSKLVITKSEINTIIKAIDAINYSIKIITDLQDLSRNININFDFLIACNLPKGNIELQDVKMLYQAIDQDIYHIKIQDNKNSITMFSVNLKHFFDSSNINKDKGYFARIAIRKHNQLIHKNLISRIKEKLTQKDHNAEQSPDLANENSQNFDIKRIMDFFR